MISRRVKYAVTARNMETRYEEGQLSLQKALNLADEARQRLRRGESFEPVTGLPNKRKFVELIRRSMGAVDRDGNSLAVIVIGFNRFRLVVEAMGQERADMILTELGKILSKYKGEWSDQEIADTAHALAEGAIKFGMLSTDPGEYVNLTPPVGC